MSTARQTSNTSGLTLWSEHIHKKAQLVGLQMENLYTAQVKVKLYDNFLTTSGRLASGGAAESREDFDTYTASGKIRFERTVPMGESLSFDERALAGVEFLGDARVVGDATTSDLVVIAQYRHKG